MTKREPRLTKKERAEKQRALNAPREPQMLNDERKWISEFLDLYSRLPYDSRNLEAARLLKFQNLPSSLFKFSAVSDEQLENLAKGQVWMSAPSAMNDPFDATFSTHAC